MSVVGVNDIDGAQPAGVYYKNCDAVRAAGAAPIYAGQPGYSRNLDRDGDGIGCENWPTTPERPPQQ